MAIRFAKRTLYPTIEHLTIPEIQASHVLTNARPSGWRSRRLLIASGTGSNDHRGDPSMFDEYRDFRILPSLLSSACAKSVEAPKTPSGDNHPGAALRRSSRSFQCLDLLLRGKAATAAFGCSAF